MGTAIRTRPAGSADLSAIAAFQTAVWNEAYRGLVPAPYLERTTVADRELRWAERIGRRDILLAERDDDGTLDLVGVASSSRREDERPGPLLELNSLYVAHGMRRSGLGARLLAELLGDAPAVLWVFAANAGAVAFYETCGFAVDGHATIDDDTGLPELRMSRP
jgi:GNAT superfamily N-acetyltransferase